MNIGIRELLKYSHPIIIDIRSHSRYLEGHIPGAISIDSSSLLLSPEEYLQKDKVYYLYCDSGFRSSMLVQKLNRMGYQTVNVIGGYHNYLLTK